MSTRARLHDLPLLTLVFSAVWPLFMLSFTAYEMMDAYLLDAEVRVERLAIQTFDRTILWIVVTPLLIYLLRVLNIRTPVRPRQIVGCIVVVVAIAGVRTTMGWGLSSLRHDRPASLHELRRSLVNTHVHALMATIAAAGILLYDFARAARDRERLRAELTMAQLQQLRSQFRPHFLLNTLNTIATLVHRDPKGADAMITSLSDLLRWSLELDEKQEVTLAEELAFARQYLSIQQVRFGERLRVSIDADADALRCAVPSLVLQPLVENAVTHGATARVEGGAVAVVARREGEWLSVEVRDDGRADPSAIQRGTGLRNVEARLEATDAGRAGLTFRRDGLQFVAAMRLRARGVGG